MIGALLDLISSEIAAGAIVALGGVLWGFLNGRSERRAGRSEAIEEITDDIMQADGEREDAIQNGLANRDGDSDVRERLRQRLAHALD